MQDIKRIEDDIDCSKIKKKYGENIILYLIDLYSPDGKSIKEFSSLIDRKTFCLNKYNINKKHAEILFSLSDELITKWISEYLRKYYDSVWTVIVANEQFFYECFYNSLNPLKTGSNVTDQDLLNALAKKSKLLEEMDKTKVRMDSYYKTLFKNVDMDGMRNVMKYESKAKNKSFNPENVVRMLSNNQ